MKFWKSRSVAKTDIFLLVVLSSTAGAVGVWSELKAAPPSGVNLEQYLTVAGEVCLSAVADGNCVADEDGYLYSAFVGSTGNDLEATKWVGGQDGSAEPGARDITTGTRFDALLGEYPDNNALAGASVSGQTSVTVFELVDGETVNEYPADVEYALLTRQIGPPSQTRTVEESWITGNLENFHKIDIWKNGGSDRPEAMDGTISMTVNGDNWLNEEPVFEGWVEKGHRLDNFPAKGDGVLTD
jgi:hypothetical protein